MNTLEKTKEAPGERWAKTPLDEAESAFDKIKAEGDP